MSHWLAPQHTHGSRRVRSAALCCVAVAARLYVLDLMPLVYRFLPRDKPAAAPPASSTTGQQTQQTPLGSAAGDCVGMVLNLINRAEEPPSHMAVVVDVPGATYRCGGDALSKPRPAARGHERTR
jgi:hypothetical protein